MLRDPADAEDATQDVFVRVFLKAHTFRGDSAFSSWLYRLTINIALMRLRRSKRNYNLPGESKEDFDHASTEIGAPDPNLCGLLYRLDLQAAIDSLPEGYKAALILHDIQGYLHNEIAEICGYSVGNSRSQLYKARRRLRNLISELRTQGVRQTSVAKNGSPRLNSNA